MANYQATPQPAADPGNTLGLVGLILAIIPCTTTIGLVLSIVAYIISRRAGFQNSKALAGIIVGAAYLVIGLILQLTMGLISGIFQMNWPDRLPTSPTYAAGHDHGIPASASRAHSVSRHQLARV